MRRLEGVLIRGTFAALMVVAAGLPLQAADFDLSVFGGVQRQGKLTLQSAPSTTANLIRTINATNFGVFGVRFGHGGVFGGEHTLAFSPNFIAADTRAFFYNSNIRIQAPLPVVKPYGTVGLGLIGTSSEGDRVGDIGTKFAINYGGGFKFMPAGPVGMRVDVRGYAVPSTEFRVFTSKSQRLDFVEVSVGVVFAFKKSQ
jgi:hypothetical protein